MKGTCSSRAPADWEEAFPPPRPQCSSPIFLTHLFNSILLQLHVLIKPLLVFVDSLFHAVSWMVFIPALTGLTSYFSKTCLHWWSQRKNASETQPKILQTGYSNPFAIGEHFQNICPCFGWLKRKAFLKYWVLKNWELNVLLL